MYPTTDCWRGLKLLNSWYNCCLLCALQLFKLQTRGKPDDFNDLLGALYCSRDKKQLTPSYASNNSFQYPFMIIISLNSSGAGHGAVDIESTLQSSCERRFVKVPAPRSARRWLGRVLLWWGALATQPSSLTNSQR